MPTSLHRRLRLIRRWSMHLLAMVLVLMALVLGAASQLLPLVERNPDRVAAWLAEKAGRPVSFERMHTQWTRRGPLLQLEGLHIGEADGGVRIGQGRGAGVDVWRLAARALVHRAAPARTGADPGAGR